MSCHCTVCCPQVSSEDSVLYTAQAWLDKQSVHEQAAAAEKLAPCINGLQLSKLWLSAIALSPDVAGGSGQEAGQGGRYLLLRTLAPAIKQYLSLTLVKHYTPQQIRGLAPELVDACPHWFLPPRRYTPLPAEGVEQQWSLPISESLGLPASRHIKTASTRYCRVQNTPHH